MGKGGQGKCRWKARIGGYNSHLPLQQGGECRLVCFVDGVGSRQRAGSCLHVTTCAKERASELNLSDFVVVDGACNGRMRSGIASAAWWELYSIHISLELVKKWRRESQTSCVGLLVSFLPNASSV